MSDLLAGRLQMALSLGFHIIFACIGMVMPFLMATSHYLWLKTEKPIYKELTKAWSRGVAMFFATGAVSGTLLSFELGLLWPNFMKHAGPIFGMPFSFEGAAFFVEAIALCFFLYGWQVLSPRIHWFMGILVGLSGVTSGVLVVAANAWMNSPSGFTYNNGVFSDIDPVSAMLNDAWFNQALHMTLAAFVATGFAVAGLHALLLIRDKSNIFHQKALRIALPFACISILLQMLSGDMAAKDVAQRQPLKFAAMEADFETTKGAPILIGGIPSEDSESVSYGIKIPYLLSLLAYGDINAEVKGLKFFPKSEWPPVLITHLAFDIMVGTGSVLVIISFIYFTILWFERRSKTGRTACPNDDTGLLLSKKWFLWILVAAMPLGFISLEAGWTVTEVGRQPWIIYGIMKTSDALTPMPGLVYSLIVYTVIYAILSVMLVILMSRQIKAVSRLSAPNLNEHL